MLTKFPFKKLPIITAILVIFVVIALFPQLNLYLASQNLKNPHNIDFTSSIDGSDISYRANGTLRYSDGQAEGEVYGGLKSVKLGFDIKIVNQNLYFKLKSFDKWYSISLNEYTGGKQEPDIRFKGFNNGFIYDYSIKPDKFKFESWTGTLRIENGEVKTVSADIKKAFIEKSYNITATLNLSKSESLNISAPLNSANYSKDLKLPF